MASVVTVATGKTATIGSNVTYENTAGSTLSITGTAAAGGSAGTLIIDNGGKVNTTHAASIVYVGSNSNQAGTVRSTTVQVNAGGTLSSASSLVANGLLKVNGGTVSSGGAGIIAIGNFADANMPASAILTIDSGTVTTAGGVRFGTSGGTTNSGGTLNLNGGTLTTPKVYSGGTASSSTVNFNGGTLKATVTNNSDFLNTNINNAIVKAGGAVINTNTFDVTISKALIHDSGLGGTADGGLTKISTGKLTLSGANTYTGDTTISGGTLTLATTGSISSSAAIKVGASGTFDVSAVSGYTLASGQTLRGSGSVTGAVIAGSGSMLAGGVDANTVGTLTFGSTLNISGLASGTGGLLFDLAGTSASDKIVSGALTIGSGVLNLNDFSFTTLSGYGVGTYTLFDATSIVGTLGSGLTGTIGGLDAVLAISGNDLVLTVSAIPEPSTYAALAGLGVLALAACRRRRA